MDKTLEMVMVIVALVVAAVLVVATLQGQTSNFGNFADQQTSDSSCGIKKSQLSQATDCSESNPYSGDNPRASSLKDDYEDECESISANAFCDCSSSPAC